MFKFTLKTLAVILLIASLGGHAPSLQAGEFNWGDFERVLDKPLAENLVDDKRSRRIEIDPIQKKKAKKKPRKTMRYNLDYAVSKVRRQYKGKVIGARTSWRGDEPVHKVKILTEDGRVRTVYVSGSSGR